MKMLVILLSGNYLQDYDEGDLKIYVEEGTPVLVFDGDLDTLQDLELDYEEV